MRNWFPFTNYDFYAYLTSGLLAVAAADYALNNIQLFNRETWSFAAIVLWIALSYVIGHFTASLSSLLIEHGIARGLLQAPTRVLLRTRARSRWASFWSRALVGHYYEPFPEPVRARILERAKKELGVEEGTRTDTEAIFQMAFAHAQRIDGVKERVEDFRNQYGFCRNIALVGFASSALFAWHFQASKQELSLWLAVLAFLVSAGMLLRFLKFYSAFSAEALRSLLK